MEDRGIRFSAPAGSLGCDVIGLLAFLPWETCELDLLFL